MSTAVQTASAEIQVGHETALSPSGKLGVWWFIASEIMVFGGLIGSYVLFRVAHGGWTDQASHVNWRLGAINTLVLVTSSLTMILALNAVRIERRQRAARFLLVTVLLGFDFSRHQIDRVHARARRGFHARPAECSGHFTTS